MDSEETSELVLAVLDEEIVAVGAFDFFYGVLEGVSGVEIIDGRVEIFGGAVGLFDFKSVEGFGMDNSKDLVAFINDGEIGKTGFVEFV